MAVIGRISDHHADGGVGAEVLDVHVSLESVVPLLGTIGFANPESREYYYLRR
jgi:hypothetical protein